jgi:hypothetical protein
MDDMDLWRRREWELVCRRLGRARVTVDRLVQRVREQRARAESLDPNTPQAAAAWEILMQYKMVLGDVLADERALTSQLRKLDGTIQANASELDEGQ